MHENKFLKIKRLFQLGAQDKLHVRDAMVSFFGDLS